MSRRIVWAFWEITFPSKIIFWFGRRDESSSGEEIVFGGRNKIRDKRRSIPRIERMNAYFLIKS